MAADGIPNNSPPCASCKALRRGCKADCVFAPYFPLKDRERYANVQEVFGNGCVAKMLGQLPVAERADAVSSLVYEATARMRDPVYGCAGAIYALQQQVAQVQVELALARAEIVHHYLSSSTASLLHQQQINQQVQQLLDQQQQQQVQVHGEIMDDVMMNNVDAAPHRQVMMDYGSSSGNPMMRLEGYRHRQEESSSLWTP